MLYASVEAVAEQWRPLDSRESAAATRLLDRASALMRLYSPELDARVAADSDLAAVASGVAVDAVLRVMRNLVVNQNGTGVDMSRVGDASLHLTSHEIQSLVGAADVGTGMGAFTIRPGVSRSGDSSELLR